jgi:hypothetical protein
VVIAPAVAAAQHRGADTGSGGAAVAIGSSGGNSGGSGGSSSSSGSSGGSSDFSGSGTSSSLGHRPGNISIPPASTNSGAFTNYSSLGFPAPEFARPRSSPPIGFAVSRNSFPLNTTNGNLTFIVGAYNPWLYAYDGLFATGFYGFFDPFLDNYGYAGPQVWTTTTPAQEVKGVLHLDIKPRHAEVYVDGGLVGKVDDFVGLFHKLRLDAGVHRLELRAPGYESITANVRIQVGESMTYRGTLEKTAR